MGITELDDNISNHYNDYIWEDQMIDENKTIETVKAENLVMKILNRPLEDVCFIIPWSLLKAFAVK